MQNEINRIATEQKRHQRYHDKNRSVAGIQIGFVVAHTKQPNSYSDAKSGDMPFSLNPGFG